MEGQRNLSIHASSPVALMEKALSAGAGLEQLEKMMELQARWEEREAKKAYVTAMAKFKANPPEILKTEKVEYARRDGKITKYNHAVLDQVADEINKGLSANGFYARWDMAQPDANTVEVTCICTHELGHSERFTMKAPPDNSDGKNPIQAISSTTTYLERITLLGITGLAAKGMDDDGRGAGKQPEYINEKQLSQIVDFINSKDIDEDAFHKYMGVSCNEEILEKDFGKALTALTKAKGKSK